VAAENGPLTVFIETETGPKLLAQRGVGPNAQLGGRRCERGYVYVPIANLGGRAVLHKVSVTTATGGDDED
jgi:hypothetical protein